jgi:hypothetical protein
MSVPCEARELAAMVMLPNATAATIHGRQNAIRLSQFFVIFYFYDARGWIDRL